MFWWLGKVGGCGVNPAYQKGVCVGVGGGGDEAVLHLDAEIARILDMTLISSGGWAVCY
jgi:hypothetical protein